MIFRSTDSRNLLSCSKQTSCPIVFVVWAFLSFQMLFWCLYGLKLLREKNIKHMGVKFQFSLKIASPVCEYHEICPFFGFFFYLSSYLKRMPCFKFYSAEGHWLIWIKNMLSLADHINYKYKFFQTERQWISGILYYNIPEIHCLSVWKKCC